LEVKREIIAGELSQPSRLVLPGLAALGGMLGPALIYLVFNHGDPAALRGWAIPAATDIAFALGIMALLGDRVPSSLRLFLLALAILDDLGAIVIIALFYTVDLSTFSLFLAGLALLGLVALNRFGVNRLAPYLLLGAFLWVCVLKSGVHATLAGVALGLAIPLKGEGLDHSPLRRLEHKLHPWVAFAILPLFAFANAGVDLRPLAFSDLLQPLPLGIAAGLLFGKPLGILLFAWVGMRLGLTRLPDGTGWGGFAGAALLCGIGFTMSLFIASLALGGAAANASRLGILLGSGLSALAGVSLLHRHFAPLRRSAGVAFRGEKGYG
ncbi:MAG: Na+/H+ antiporter NhaA, partial [Desulfuromonas sp.]